MKKFLAIMLGVILCLGVVMMTGCGVFDGKYTEVDWKKAQEVTDGLDSTAFLSPTDKSGIEVKVDGMYTSEFAIVYDKDTTLNYYHYDKNDIDLNVKSVKNGDKINSELKNSSYSEMVEKFSLVSDKTETKYEYNKENLNAKMYFDGEYNYSNSDQFTDYLLKTNLKTIDENDEEINKAKMASIVDGTKLFAAELLGEWIPELTMDAEDLVLAFEGKEGVRFYLDEQKDTENKLKIEVSSAQVLENIGLIKKAYYGENVKIERAQVVFVFDKQAKKVTNWKLDVKFAGNYGKFDLVASIESYTGKVSIPDEVKKYETVLG